MHLMDGAVLIQLDRESGTLSQPSLGMSFGASGS